MGFRKDAYCTVWEVKQGSGNFSDARISTSKKNKQTGEYETDFSGFVRFIGSAHQKSSSLKEKDRIKLGDCEVTNRYDKEKKVTYIDLYSMLEKDEKLDEEYSDDGIHLNDDGYRQMLKMVNKYTTKDCIFHSLRSHSVEILTFA